VLAIREQGRERIVRGKHAQGMPGGRLSPQITGKCMNPARFILNQMSPAEFEGTQASISTVIAASTDSVRDQPVQWLMRATMSVRRSHPAGRPRCMR